MRVLLVSLALLACLVEQSASQLSGWESKQINTSICYWNQPRAALVRDTVYLDGGDLWWSPGLDDGSTAPPTTDKSDQGRILTYNLSRSFQSDTDITKLLLEDSFNKSDSSDKGTNGAYLNFVDGGLLANDAGFILYGGLPQIIPGVDDAPEKDKSLRYNAYADGPKEENFKAGIRTTTLGKGVTPYIAFGAAVSAPSENKAWYFSGLTSPSRGPISKGDKGDMRAANVSDTLITVDMEVQFFEKWKNDTLPSDIEGRANAEVVWVPVGKQGILVVLGGVVFPSWAGERSGRSDDEEKSEEDSPKFMETIDIYDVASGDWYKQTTKDGPKTRTRGCAIVAPASDRTSFNIYYYGGFDGLHPKEAFSDDVWVLSLPSFTWTRVNEGKTSHARAGHKCFMPYPDQMMVFGGYLPLPGTNPSCLERPVEIFNLSSAEWLQSYDPAIYSDYGVPDKVQKAIGGDAAGGATATAPDSGWATSALAKVFDTKYEKDISTYWPYEPVATSDRPSLEGEPDDDDKGGSGLPSWVAPVLGVVLGLMFLTGLLILFCLWRRRKIFRNRPSDYGTEDPGKRIISWMKGQPAEKATTVTTSDDQPVSPGMMEAATVARPMATESTSTPARDPIPGPIEMPNTQLVELADTSPPAELYDTGLSPVEIIQKHSRLSQQKAQTPATGSPSSFSFVGGSIDHASTVSRSTKDAANNNTDPADTRVTSVVSDMSKPEHMRHLSEGTVSIDSAIKEEKPQEEPPLEDQPRAESRATSDIESAAKLPVSPPSVGDSGADDYISARSTANPLRRSVFRESEEDMGKHR